VEALPRTNEEEAVVMGTAFAPLHPALPPDAARLARLLALHPGPRFGVEAVSALAAVAPPRARMLLDVLTDAGLLERTAPDRHRFPEDHHPELPRDQHAALRRVLDWYLHTAAAAQRWISPHAEPVPLGPADGVTPRSFATYDQAVDWSEREHPNLVHAARAAEQTGLDGHAHQLSAVLWNAHPPSAGSRPWLPVGEAGLRAARRARDRAAEAALLDNLGTAYRQTGRLPEALACHEEALAMGRALGDGRGEATSLLGLGAVHLAARRLTEAGTHFRQALALFEAVGATHWRAVALTHLAATHHEAGRLPEATRAIHEAETAHRREGAERALAEALCTLSAVRLEHGALEAALTAADQAVTLSLGLRARPLEARCLLHLGNAQQALAGHGDALASYHRSATLHRRLGDRTREALAWHGAGQTYHRTGRDSEAAAFHSQAARAHRELGDTWNEARALDGFAAALRPEHPGTARRHWIEALRLLTGHCDPRAAEMRRQIENQLTQSG
jgi:tetratricopeptide (TPR) repeat protein